MIKSFSGQVVFCFAILRAISAYVGENRLSQYSLMFWLLNDGGFILTPLVSFILYTVELFSHL